MFHCQLCQGVVPPRTPSQRLVVQSRKKEYPFRFQANTFTRLNDNGKRKEFHTDDPGGIGQEIVKELIVCPDCAAKNGHQ